MKRNFIVGTLVLTTFVAAANPAQASKETAGTIIGGLLGGVAGSAIGKGHGKTAATIIGGVIGSVIGNRVGQSLDDQDRRACAEAQRRAFAGEVGRDYKWRGSRADGEFRTVREGRDRRTGEICREYYSVIETRNGREETRGIACRSRDGSWRETETRYVEYGPSYDRREMSERVEVRGLYRRGGERVSLILNKPVQISRMEIRTRREGIVIRNARVVTDRNRSFDIRSVQGALYPHSSQRYQLLPQRISEIYLQIESLGGPADIEIILYSQDGNPRVVRN